MIFGKRIFISDIFEISFLKYGTYDFPFSQFNINEVCYTRPHLASPQTYRLTCFFQMTIHTSPWPLLPPPPPTGKEKEMVVKVSLMVVVD